MLKSFIICFFLSSINGYVLNRFSQTPKLNVFSYTYGNPFGKKYFDELQKNKTLQENANANENETENELFEPFEPQIIIYRKYPIVSPSFIEKMRQLNSKNITEQNNSILNSEYANSEEYNNFSDENLDPDEPPQLRIIIKKANFLEQMGIRFNDENQDVSGFFEENENGRRSYKETPNDKSKNFQVIKDYNVCFDDVGGYKNVKEELMQCVDILKNYNKYAKFNVLTPK